MTESSPQGGLANYTWKVAHALTVRGVDVSVFCLADHRGVWQDGRVKVFFAKYASANKHLSLLPGMGAMLGAIAQYESARRVRSLVMQVHQDHPLDLVQTSTYYTPGFCLRRGRHFPIVCRITSNALLWRTGYGLKTRFGHWLTDRMEVHEVADACAAFSPSDAMARVYRSLTGRNIDVIRTPLDPESVEFDESFYREQLFGKRYLLYFGTLNRNKGLDLIAEVLPSLLNRHPQLYFAFIGRDHGFADGRTVSEVVRKRASSYADRIVFHAGLPKSSLYPVVQRAVAVLMPSRFDNYPNSCLEALSLGTPVVASRDSSLDEMLEDGVTGFLAANGSADALRDAIERVLSLSDEARETVRGNIARSVGLMRREDRIGILADYYGRIIGDWKRDRKSS